MSYKGTIIASAAILSIGTASYLAADSIIDSVEKAMGSMLKEPIAAAMQPFEEVFQPVEAENSALNRLVNQYEVETLSSKITEIDFNTRSCSKNKYLAATK